MNAYIKQQRLNTIDYINTEVKPYASEIDINELDSLLNQLGLYIDFKESEKYYNTLNEKPFLCWDLQVYCKVSKKLWCCIDTIWYKNNIGNYPNKENYTETYHRFKEIRNGYYSVYKHALVEI